MRPCQRSVELAAKQFFDKLKPAPRSRSGRTNCQKDQQPFRPLAAKNQASWYGSSWRGLQSDASTPDDSRLITPETTPPSIPTNSATAPRRVVRLHNNKHAFSRPNSLSRPATLSPSNAAALAAARDGARPTKSERPQSASMKGDITWSNVDVGDTTTHRANSLATTARMKR